MNNSELKWNSETETIDEYINRICAIKDRLGLSWQAISIIINEETGLSYTESRYRKNFNKNQEEQTLENVVSSNEDSEQEETLRDLILEYKKAKVKLSEERIQNNAYIRQLSREDTMKEIAHDFATKMSSKKILTDYSDNFSISYDANEGILTISDWHYGMVIDNFWNKYNPETAIKRINKLKNEVIRIGQEAGISKLHIVNLSDLIAGRIHLQLRIESRYDVITQTMKVAEILAEFLNDLSKYFQIEYYDCLDNHSRLEPNKKESIDLESLTRMIPWYLKERLSQNKQIQIHDNIFSDDIIVFACKGHKVAAVHGDKDKQHSVIKNLTMMTKLNYDLVLTAHLHHFSSDEQNECVLLSNGSLMGTDTLAKNLRLSAIPSQNMVIVSEDNVLYSLHKINLN